MITHSDNRNFKCNICDKSFNYKRILQSHIQSVHQNLRPFDCSFCDKRFNLKHDMKLHVRLHTGDFPYNCPVDNCDEKYPAWSNLFKHCQSRHKLDIRSEDFKQQKFTKNNDFV